MKKIFGTITKALGFGKKDNTTPIVVNSDSQHNVLQAYMRRQNMTHGETVNADLSNVKVVQQKGEAVMYFCPMNGITVRAKVSDGDGGSLPSRTTIEGLKFPKEGKSGNYNLKNVKLTSNGTMQVHATADTVWEPA
jgi:hypothetical protein